MKEKACTRGCLSKAFVESSGGLLVLGQTVAAGRRGHVSLASSPDGYHQLSQKMLEKVQYYAALFCPGLGPLSPVKLFIVRSVLLSQETKDRFGEVEEHPGWQLRDTPNETEG